jgi:hypothetical protein
VQEGSCDLIEAGTEFELPVGFHATDWRTVDPGPTTVRRIGRGRYAVESAPVFTSELYWEIELGALRLSTDVWEPHSVARAKALAVGDHFSGEVRLELDPTHEGDAPLLRTDRIELYDGDWGKADDVGAAWRSVPAVRTSDLYGVAHFAILLTCTRIG